MKKSDLVNDIANMDNLMLAWCKLEGELSQLDDWYDVMEFYGYKFQLKEKLVSLHDRIANGSYQMQPLRPLPFPKGPSKTEEGLLELRVRQFFHIAIEDQLVWIAYCNVIAQYVERCMPGWSFGNRTDVRVWYKDVNGKRELQAGNYRNTRNNIYKKWGQSWPRYRKLLSLTIKLMSKNELRKYHKIELSEEEKQLLKDNEKYAEQKLDYLDKDYFKQLEGEQLYWAGIDIEKFYPAIKRKLITDNLSKIIYMDRQTPEFWRLTNALLDFKIDVTGYLPKELNAMKIDGLGMYPIGLPTGLLVAGFLSNLAFWEIDEKVKGWLVGNHKVAHFRYVDDHVILAQSREALVEWVKKYVALLNENGFTINKDKTEPQTLSQILKEEKGTDELVGLNPSYPSPLMTLTLQKVSQMADMNVDQLSKTEFDILFADLQELLIMDISDQEIKKETRISFAVTMLSRILVHGDVDYEELCRLKQELRKELENKGLVDLKKESSNEKWLEWFYRDDEYPALPTDGDNDLKASLKTAEEKSLQINYLLQHAKSNCDKKYDYIFGLITKALEDVPERTRIWIRMIQYCYKYKPEYIVDVFGMLGGNAITGKLHLQDVVYLKIMLLNKLAELIMRDLPRKEHEKRYKDARHQLTVILGETVRDIAHEKYHEKETYLYVDYVLKLEQMVNNQAQMQIKTENLYHGASVDADFWVLYYLQYVREDDLEMKHEVIRTIMPNIRTDSPYYPTLFLKCMSSPQFQEDVLKDGSLDDELVKYVKRHHLEIDVYRTFSKEYRSMVAAFFNMEKVEEDLGDYITLSEWILRLGDYDNPPLLHTEQLEYIALKVVRSVIKVMDKIHNDIFGFTLADRPVNLFNLSIKKKCLDMIDNMEFWDDADELIRYDSSVCPVSVFPFDNSLFPKEYRDVYDIGIILLQMIVLNHLPSDYLVDAEYGYKWERIIKRLMQQGYMSFYTFMVLMSCLSKRNRETMLFKKRGDKDIRPDEDLDPPIISNLKEMLAYVEQAMHLLKENRVALPNKKYRTLTVVSLDSYRKFAENVRQNKAVTKEELEDYLKVDIVQTNLDSRQAWSGLKDKGYDMTESEMKKCWSEIVMFFKQITDMDEDVRPQIVILPEFAFDRGYYRQMKKLSDKSGCLVIAGRNFVEVPDKKIMNKAAVFVPYHWPNGHGNTSTPDFEFGKYFFAKVEEDFIRNIGYEPKSYDKMYLVDTGCYGKMGLAICADFYDIERFAIYRGRIQHLVIIAYNKDVKSFYFLAEAISRIIFCNVVICNTGFYGGSIAFAPYKDEYKRYVYKHEGGNLYTNQIVLLPVASLFEAQHNENDDRFKGRPPGFKAL